ARAHRRAAGRVHARQPRPGRRLAGGGTSYGRILLSSTRRPSGRYPVGRRPRRHVRLDGHRVDVENDGARGRMNDIAPSSGLSLGPPGNGRHPTVSIVSVNYNGRRYLERFITSVLAIDYPPSCYRLVLVDNASTDGSDAFVRETFPQ